MGIKRVVVGADVIRIDIIDKDQMTLINAPAECGENYSDGTNFKTLIVKT